jgi:hypothetical protein
VDYFCNFQINCSKKTIANRVTLRVSKYQTELLKLPLVGSFHSGALRYFVEVRVAELKVGEQYEVEVLENDKLSHRHIIIIVPN